MNALPDRIVAVRKALSLTQNEFGARLGLSRKAISAYERGMSEPSQTILLFICREYGINRQWLEQGIGPMFLPDEDNEFEMIDRLLVAKDKESRLAAALLKGIVRYPGGWEALAKAVNTMAKALEEISDAPLREDEVADETEPAAPADDKDI